MVSHKLQSVLGKLRDEGSVQCLILVLHELFGAGMECVKLLDLLNMERSTFYDRKREAILLLGVSLWGYAIPCFKGIFNMKGADESDDIPDFFK